MINDNFHKEIKRLKYRLFGNSDSTNIIKIENDNNNQFEELIEDENNYELELKIPGISKENIKVDIKNNNLIIKAEKKQEIKQEDENKSYYRYAKSFAGFYRMISIPENADIDNIDSEYKNGILKIVIPKNKNSKRKIVKIE